jgi:DNA-binding transcriptional LysR family regulator
MCACDNSLALDWLDMNRFSEMEAFVRVVEAGSFSSAAKQLGVGQPYVSKLIAQLEERLGVHLLSRTTHGMTPTEAGRSFYQHSQHALVAAEEAEFAARGAATSLKGRLRVGAAVTFARIHIIPYLPSLLAQHPELQIEMVLDDRNVDLIEAGIDVALRMGALSDSSLTARKIAQGKRVVLATPSYFAVAGTPKMPHELGAHESVIYDQRGGGSTWTFRSGDEEASVTLKGRIRVNAAEGVRAAVLCGFGLTVSSQWMFAPELASKTVETCLSEWQLPAIDLWAVFPSGRKVSSKARSFADFVQARMQTSETLS